MNYPLSSVSISSRIAVFGFALVMAAQAGALVNEPSPAAKALFGTAKALYGKNENAAALKDLEGAIEDSPDYIEAHELFAEVGRRSFDYTIEGSQKAALGRLAGIYESWERKYPNSAAVEYGFGHLYAEFENPSAKPHLLKAVSKDPSLAKAYFDLSMDASRWGDEAGSRNYMEKASSLEPNDPTYAFYAASDWDGVDDAKWIRKSLGVAKRFPDSERGAQALYWLAERAKSDEEKAQYFEMLKTDFPPSKFSWSADGMSRLYDLYLRTDPAKAVALATELTPNKVDYGRSWAENADLASSVLQVRELISAGKFSDAETLLQKQSQEKKGGDILRSKMFALYMAEAAAGAGKPQQAYDSMVERYAKTPEDEIRSAGVKYGAGLGKTPDQFDSDVWTIRDKNSRAAPPFDLGLYTSNKKVSLADFKGKVVLITFWFPGCGPCRGEMPHFETVLKHFKGQNVSYVGINVSPEQDPYVLPFMRSTKFSFTPLRGIAAITEKAFKVRGEPTNFLIDGDGRIVYDNFYARDPDSEQLLRRMIESLLSRKKPVASIPDRSANR